MDFRYINPGLKDLFDVIAADTTQGRDTSLMLSRTSGDYFSFGDSSARSYLNLEPSDEYWIAFYCVSKYNAYFGNHLMVSVYNGVQNKGVCLFRPVNTNKLGFLGQGDAVIVPADTDLSLNQGYHVEIYLKRGVDGKIAMWVDGKQMVDVAMDLSYIDSFDKIYFGGERMQANATYYSDLIIQSTGRIGGMRVNYIPASDMVCEWDSCTVPVGNKAEVTSTTMSLDKTTVLTQHPFAVAGVVGAVVVKSQINSNNASINYKFCLLRKNSATGKYNPVEVSDVYALGFAQTGVHKIELRAPMRAEVGDYLGFYASGSSAYLCAEQTSAGRYASFAADVTGSAELTMPSDSTGYKHCIFALLTPDDLEGGVELLYQLQKEDSALALEGYFTTSSVDKMVLNTVDPQQIDDMQIGRVDTVAISAYAHYEGENPKGICAVLKSGDTLREESVKSVSMVSTLYNLAVLHQDPITGAAWSVNGLKNMSVGIKSKA